MSTEHPKIVTVPPHFDETRLDKAVKELFQVPWSTARTWIERGKISVDNTRSTDLAFVVQQGAQLCLTPDARRPSRTGDFSKERIVHIDPHLVVADKPAGILTVPLLERDPHSFDAQIRTYLTKHRSKTARKKGALASLLVVHRLDKLTSGLLVFPRTVEAMDGLKSQFREHTVKRHYLALVHGVIKPQTFKTHIMEDRGDGIRGSCETSPHPKVRKSQKGQLAITHVEVVEQLKSATLIKCTLDTGRTNQIRIHLAEHGHPLIGERTYMRGFKGKKINSLQLMLHAAELGFTHPISQEPMHFTAEPPDYFLQMHRQLKK
ncbi:MAG: RluA family pseudouridine synthase [Deltaproteobacteria bacterium]|nr:RluA family pseudouridine synthase [Deltaproteobacteria bacterium]MBN2672010.1 RluA family pseudouridine synthase [Deltaproteobacteria bacterium]